MSKIETELHKLLNLGADDTNYNPTPFFDNNALGLQQW